VRIGSWRGTREPAQPLNPDCSRNLSARFGGLPFLAAAWRERSGPTSCLTPRHTAPRYHFHVIDAVKVFDPEGVTLPDERAAQHYARRTARNFRRILRGKNSKSA
jgi:hypothetical protein